MSHNSQPTTCHTLLFLLFLSSCAVLKNKQTEEQSSASSQEASQVQISALSGIQQQTRILTFADSSDHRYTAEIFPLGDFHYSAAEGFSGTASRIIIHGKLKTAGSGKDSITANQQTDQHTALLSHAETKDSASEVTRQKQTKHSNNAWLWLVLASCIICLILVVFKQRN
ncbi:hypothetical protein BDE36_1128 [Arcticibacter tournemirensis]|uniref:Uncharacterized protein n=1 Tax=Arcticibacter tournemirensis TaxID=699437 RepID=A0A5M9H6V3_9SPHI|nr:hypothetical protein [Arcticibacter tournemirensis]KAA8482019.1 hypothetical protein F1649_12820 [Arcticibacter tournemirensis]TQM49423.1 hypothetical protein BDE36_1128 [Arcticibacter tournemirensis]